MAEEVIKGGRVDKMEVHKGAQAVEEVVKDVVGVGLMLVALEVGVSKKEVTGREKKIILKMMKWIGKIQIGKIGMSQKKNGAILMRNMKRKVRGEKEGAK